MPEHNLIVDRPLALHPLLHRLRPILLEVHVPVFLVGGVVRDSLLGHASQDLDFVVPANAIDIAYHVGDELGLPAFILDRERDIGRVVHEEAGTTLDFARFRGSDLFADLSARDFTINSMALPVAALSAAAIIDPLDGLADLEARTVRLSYPSAIEDDPVRALRALRIALRYAFALTPDTVEAVRRSAPLLSTVSNERIRDELLKLMADDAADRSVEEMGAMGLLPVVLPEIAALRGLEQPPPHHETVLAHTISVLRWLRTVERATTSGHADNIGAAAEVLSTRLSPFRHGLCKHLERELDGGVAGMTLLRFAGLFHDVGKRESRTVAADGRVRFVGHESEGAIIARRRLRQLRMSSAAVRHVELVVANHMRPLSLVQASKLTRRAAFRFYRATGDAGLDVVLLSLADHLATYDGPGPQEVWQRLLDVTGYLLHQYFDAYDDTVAPQLLLDGHDLMDGLGLEPGPEIGRLLRLVEEAQAAGDIHSKDEALALARRHKQ